MRASVVSLLLVSLVGCGTGAPDDLLLLQGEAPPGVELVLERSLSTQCFRPPDTEMGAEPFEELARTHADSAGGYTFELFRAQTLPGAAQSPCFRVTRAGDPGTEARAQFFQSDIRAAPLKPWAARPQLTEAGWQAGALPGLPEGNLFTFGVYEWQLDVAGLPLWRADAQAPWVATPEHLEGFAEARLSAVGFGHFLHYDESLGVLFATYTEGSLRVRTEQVEVAPLASPLPVTRGTDCLLDGELESPCPATDGSLARVPLTGQRSLELRWSEPRPVRALLLRGLESHAERILIEVAQGEGGWVQVGELVAPEVSWEDYGNDSLRTPGRWEQLALGGVQADRLRLRSEQGGLYGVREVSVFE